MKKLLSICMCSIALTALGQNKTIRKNGWIKEPQHYYSKSGRDMNQMDTLELVPYNKYWLLCCLHLTSGCSKTLLFDVGVYHEKTQNKQTVKGGVGMYLPDINTIVTADYHRTVKTQSQAVGLNVLVQLGKVYTSGTPLSFHPIRAGFNLGIYKPKNQIGVPFIEPKIGIIMPFGRGHLYSSYRFISGSTEVFRATKGWNVGMTSLLTKGR